MNTYQSKKNKGSLAETFANIQAGRPKTPVESLFTDGAMWLDILLTAI